MILGFVWGGHRLRVHRKEEEIFRAAEAKRKAIRDVHMAEEKKRLAKRKSVPQGWDCIY